MAVDERRVLVERVAASRYVKRSARLRDLLEYLATRVLDENATEVHEQEVGHRVFGRATDYDTASDNIVRVHASLLRKRLEQYFAAEGSEEALAVELPKGNYALAFKSRVVPTSPSGDPPRADLPSLSAEPPAPPRRDVIRYLALASTAVFAGSTGLLWWRQNRKPAPLAQRPAATSFWGMIFQPNRAADIVFDDASAGQYQEMTGKDLPLSAYYDRTYLRSIPQPSTVIRRQSSFSSANLLWKMVQVPEIVGKPTVLRFARDYSFRELRSNNVVLLGNPRSNPWMEPFQSKLSLHWTYESESGSYYPSDANRTFQPPRSAPEAPQGYCGISLLPNLGQTGNVLLITGTGGSTLNLGADFLSDEGALADLRGRLGGAAGSPYPYFEVLLRVKGRGSSLRDSVLEVCRRL